MTADAWILVAEAGPLGGLVEAAREVGGHVTAAVVGPRALAESVAAAQPDAVAWFETDEQVPAEAHAERVADAVAQASPAVLLASSAPSSRVLLGVAASRVGAAVLTAVRSVAVQDDAVVVVRGAVAGKVLETCESPGPVAALFEGEDVPAGGGPPARIDAIAPVGSVASLRVVATIPAGEASTGMLTADRVVAVGCGLRSRADMALIEELAAALGAEIGCSMPIADDFGWVPKDRYIGRSGQHIAPALYVAVGISGQPQHLEGVRDARVIVGINEDPAAPIFKHCNYGIVGDLYEVVPALTAAVSESSQAVPT